MKLHIMSDERDLSYNLVEDHSLCGRWHGYVFPVTETVYHTSDKGSDWCRTCARIAEHRIIDSGKERGRDD